MEQTNNEKNLLERIKPFAFLVLFVIVLCGAAWKTLQTGYDHETLELLVFAVAILLVHNAKSFSFGSAKVELQEKVNNLQELTQALSDLGEQRSGKFREANIAKRESTVPAVVEKAIPNAATAATQEAVVIDKEDPVKGQYGGRSVVNDRELTATLTPIPGRTSLTRIHLEVLSTSKQKPLTGTVTFALHPTFKNASPSVNVVGGKAVLNLVAWGCFTVGAMADNGQTKLELDLFTVYGAKKEFYER